MTPNALPTRNPSTRTPTAGRSQAQAGRTMELLVLVGVVPVLLALGILLAAPQLGLSGHQLLAGTPLAWLFWVVVAGLLARSLLATSDPAREEVGAAVDGGFTPAARTRQAVVLMAGDGGVQRVGELLAGIRPLEARSLVVLRGSSREALGDCTGIQAICRAKGVRLVTLVGPAADGWAPAGQPASLVQLVPWIADADLFVCGPAGWVAQVVAEAGAYGVPPGQLHRAVAG